MHRRVWSKFHAAGTRDAERREKLRAEAAREKAAAEEEFENSLAAARAIFDSAGTPPVLAFEAAAASEEAARERLARAAPEAWIAFATANSPSQ